MPVRRSVVSVILLSIVTCGIYYLYWIYVTSSDVKTFLGDPNNSPGVELILCLVTCGLYSIYWFYKYNRLMGEMCARAQMPYNDNTILCTVLPIFGLSIVSMAIMQDQLNSIWNNTYYRNA